MFFCLIIGFCELASLAYATNAGSACLKEDTECYRIAKLELDLENLKKELKLSQELAISLLEHRGREMEKGFADMKQKYEEIATRQRKNDTVAFMACFSKGEETGLEPNKTIVLSAVITNVGSAYNPSTGIFIAPMKGVYRFYLSALTGYNKSQYVAIVVGVEPKIIKYMIVDARNVQNWQAASKEWIFSLEKGTNVWLIAGIHSTGELHGDCWTSFSGQLLFALD